MLLAVQRCAEQCSAVQFRRSGQPVVQSVTAFSAATVRSVKLFWMLKADVDNPPTFALIT